MTAFAIHILEKLNGNVDITEPVTEVLEEIRAFFQFGCSFVYEADHKGVFYLQEHSEAYPNRHLGLEIDLMGALGAETMREIGGQKVVLFAPDREHTQLEKTLEALFDAQSLILIPMKDQHDAIIALVGLVDRRSADRHLQMDLEFAYSLLAAVANHIKLRLYQARIESTQKSLESVLDHMGVDIYVNDFNTHEVLYANQSMAAPYGGKQNMVGKICWQVLYDDKTGQCEYCPQKKLLDENGEPTKIYSWDYERPFDGSWFRVLSGAFQWVDGRLAHVVSSVDITENKRNEALVRQLADYDALTNLPNRRKLMRDCQEQIATMPEDGTGYVLFFDLDGFKQINDRIGHQTGDDLLAAIGLFLQETPLLRDRSYRHGGDEFVALMPNQDRRSVLGAVACLFRRFAQPWQLGEASVRCGTSIGIAEYPSDARTPAELLHKADMAMYEAKRAGKGVARFYNGGAFSSPEEWLDGEELI